MITLIHGTDLYLSYKHLKEKRDYYQNKGFEIKIINTDDDFEVPDTTTLYAALTEQDLFGSQKLLILKRVTSSDLLYKLGRPLKLADKFFEILKTTTNEVLIWEDKNITAANPLSKIANEIKAFMSPVKEYEVNGYISTHFKDISPNIKKFLLNDLKTTDTLEIAMEVEKLKHMPEIHINAENIVLTKNIPTWIIGDSITAYLANSNDKTLLKVFETLKSIDEDIRYKLAIIQNHLIDLAAAKQIKNGNKKIQEKFYPPKRAFLLQKLNPILNNIKSSVLYELYAKSIITEYLLNNGIVNENYALENIFLMDFKSMSSELID